MDAGWAAVALVLVLSLAAHPAEARSPKAMMDTDWLSLGRNTGRQLMQDSGAACPAGFPAITGRGPTTAPAGATVQFSDLKKLGWAVTSRANSTDAPSTYTGLADFYSVMCNSFRNVAASRAACTTASNSKLVGATHMRYDCTDKSFWVLTYAFKDFGFSSFTGDIWINTDCGACDNGKGDKEISYSGNASGGNCGSLAQLNSPCSAATCSGSSCGVCCNDMWPVIDNGRWVGYLAKAHFGLPTGAVAAWDTMLVHWDWSEDPTATTGSNTASSSTAAGAPAPGACWQCSGFPNLPPSPEEPPAPPTSPEQPPVEPGPLCPPVTLTVTPPTGTSYCIGSESVDIDFTVASTDTLTPFGYDIQAPAGVTCSGAVTGTVYRVTCTGAPLPELGLSVTLNVTQAPTADCAVSSAQTATVTVRTPPVPSVQLSDATLTKCSSEAEITLSATVGTDTGVAVAVDVTPTFCKIGSESSVKDVQSGSSVTITCTKPDAISGGWPANFLVEITATGGDDDCSASNVGTTNVTVLTKPEVTVTGPTSEELCNDSPSVRYTYTVSSGDAGVPLSVTATSSDASVSCSIPPGGPVESGSAVTVTCTPASSWPEGSFSVEVQATAATVLDGCAGTKTTTTTVQVNKKPEISITKPENVAVCQRDTSLTLSYTISSGASNLPFNVTTYNSCQATPNVNVPSNSQVNVTCQGNWMTDFTINLQADAGVTGCADNKGAEVPVRFIPLPTLALSGDATKDVCANSGSTTLRYTASATVSGAGVPWSLTFTTTAAGVTCEAKNGTGQVSNMNVVCSTADGSALPESFNVTGTLTSGETGCIDTATFDTSVTASCCIKGSSYARGQLDTPSFSNATCFSTGMPCGNSNWGWTNKLSGEGSATYPIIVVGGNDCKGRTTVGAVSITCAADGTGSEVTIGPLDQKIIGTGLANHLYVGCAANNACTPSSYYQPPRNSKTKISACGGSSASMCGGNVASYPLKAKLTCGCGSVNWVFHQSYDFFTTPRVEGGACPAQ